jgi:WD40 repeat protein
MSLFLAVVIRYLRLYFNIQTVKVWKIDFNHHDPKRITLITSDNKRVTVFEPVSSNINLNKVRDCQFNSKTRKALSLSTDNNTGCVKLWDMAQNECREVASINLEEPKEAVCIAVDRENNLYSVGSSCHISIIDPRCSSVVKVFPSLDTGWGVRSMSIDNQVITIGGILFAY